MKIPSNNSKASAGLAKGAEELNLTVGGVDAKDFAVIMDSQVPGDTMTMRYAHLSTADIEASAMRSAAIISRQLGGGSVQAGVFMLYQ